MRAYFFNNSYLKGIDNGIQAGHALDHLWVILVDKVLGKSKREAKRVRSQLDFLRTFSRDHKTWIILKNGDHDSLEDLIAFMGQQKELPFAYFDEPGLNNAHTSIVVILPERLYDDVANEVGRAAQKVHGTKFPHHWKTQISVSTLQKAEDRNYTTWEVEFLRLKAGCGLAS